MDLVSKINLSLMFKFFKEEIPAYNFDSFLDKVDSHFSQYLASNMQSVGILRVLSTSIDRRDSLPSLVINTSTGCDHVKQTRSMCLLGLK